MVEFARQSMVGVFARIAREHLHRFLSCEGEIAQLYESLSQAECEDEKLDVECELRPTEWARDEAGVITIVFAALAVEAYIYDYAGRHISDSFVTKSVKHALQEIARSGFA